MGLEQFSVGFLICLVLNVIFWLIAIFINWIDDDCEGFGYTLMMTFSCVGFGICLTYITYMKGVL